MQWYATKLLLKVMNVPVIDTRLDISHAFKHGWAETCPCFILSFSANYASPVSNDNINLAKGTTPIHIFLYSETIPVPCSPEQRRASST